MALEVEDFSIDIQYLKNVDELKLLADRDLRNGDILLVLVHLLHAVEKESRADIIKLAFEVLENQELKITQNLN